MERFIADVAAAMRSAAHHWPVLLANAGLMMVGVVGTCIFVSLSDATIEGDLKFPNAERLRTVDAIVDGVEFAGNTISAAELPSIAAADVFERMTVLRRWSYTVALTEDRAKRYQGARADAETASTLGVSPLLGRWFRPSDAASGAVPVVVIGYDLWRTAFAGAADAIGTSITVGGSRREVVGIMPQGFAFPLHEQLWLPLASPASINPNDKRRFAVFGTLKDGMSDRSASVAVASAVRAAAVDASRDRSAQVRRMQLSVLGTGVVIVYTMEVVAYLLYALACANTVGLLAGRAVGRLREIRIRHVVGASTGRLLWQLTLEGLVVACVALLFAIPLAAFALERIEELVFANIAWAPFWWSFDLSPRAIWIAVTAVPVTSVVVGTLPVLATVGLRPMQGREKRRSASRLLGLGLVLLQTFVCVLLVTVAMVFLRTLADRTEHGLGFDPQRFLHAQIELPEAAAKRGAFAKAVADIERATRATPIFDGIAVMDFIPGVGVGLATVQRTDGTTFKTNLARVSDRFFEVVLPLEDAAGDGSARGLLRGRQAVVTARFRELLGESRFVFESQFGSPWRVVGTVGDVLTGGGFQPSAEYPTAFVALPPRRLLSVMLRYASGPSAGAAEEARRALASALPGVGVFEVLPLQRVIEKRAAGIPVVTQMLLVVATVATAFALAGLIGVVGNQAAQTRREIGIRRAVGARPARIVLRIGGRMWAASVAGVASGVAVSAYMQAMLGRLVDAAWLWDVTYAAIVLLIVGIAIAGTVLRLMDDSPYGGVREH